MVTPKQKDQERKSQLLVLETVYAEGYTEVFSFSHQMISLPTVDGENDF